MLIGQQQYASPSSSWFNSWCTWPNLPCQFHDPRKISLQPTSRSQPAVWEHLSYPILSHQYLRWVRKWFTEEYWQASPIGQYHWTLVLAKVGALRRSQTEVQKYKYAELRTSGQLLKGWSSPAQKWWGKECPITKAKGGSWGWIQGGRRWHPSMDNLTYLLYLLGLVPTTWLVQVQWTYWRLGGIWKL